MAETNEGGWVLSDEALAKVVKAVRKTLGKSNTQRDDRLDARDSGPVNWVPFVNVSSEAVPPNGLMAASTELFITRSGDDVLGVSYKCTRASTKFTRRLAINYPVRVAPGDSGLCSFEGPIDVVHDSTSAPVVGDVFGIKPGQFTASKNYPGELHCDGVVDGTGKLIRVSFTGEISKVLVKPTATIADTTTGTVGVWAGAAGSEVDTGWKITGVKNRTGADATTAQFAKVEWVNGVPTVFGGGVGTAMYLALLNGTLASGSTSATIDTVTTLSGSTAGAPALTTVANPMGWVGVDNDSCLIVVGAANILLNVKPRVVTLVTDIVDNTTGLGKSYRQAAVNTSAIADSTSTVLSFSTC